MDECRDRCAQSGQRKPDVTGLLGSQLHALKAVHDRPACLISDANAKSGYTPPHHN
jgi:hypothetical protein